MIKMVLDGVEYPTKKAVISAVRKEIQKHALGEEFESALISDLIALHHVRCVYLGLRPIKFKAIPERPGDGTPGGYRFRGLFPEIGWHGVSWRKSVTPPTWNGEKTRLLRNQCDSDMETYRFKNYRCVDCGKQEPPLHCHHDDPTFREMAARVDHLFTHEDRIAWENSDWTKEEEFSLGCDHPAYVEFRKIHSKAKMIVLCNKCHNIRHGKKSK